MMDLQSKPEASERAIPEKDKHENEKLKVALKLQYSPLSPVKRRQRPRMAQRQQDIQRPNDGAKKIMTHSMDLQNKPPAPEQLVERRPKRMKTEVEEISKWSVDMHSKPVTPEEKNRKNERETLFVAFDLESTGEMPSFFFAVIALL